MTGSCWETGSAGDWVTWLVAEQLNRKNMAAVNIRNLGKGVFNKFLIIFPA
jgi:hypothetical protein